MFFRFSKKILKSMFLFVFAVSTKQGILIINLKVIVASIKGIKWNDLAICFCAKNWL